MSAVSDWGLVEAAIIASGPTAIGALLGVCWNMLGQRIKAIDERVAETNKHVGKHYSDINDTKDRVTAIEKEIDIRVAMADERDKRLTAQVNKCTDELQKSIDKLEKKLDDLINIVYERRSQPRE